MHNVGSQARLIDDLLDLSRILSDKLRLELQEVDAVKVVEKAAEVVRSATVARRVSIDVLGDGRPLIMQIDAVRLEQVVWNLVNNAVHASPEGGRVEVRYERAGARLRVEVIDFGRGIDAADLSLIFEPFRQAQGPQNAHRGLGLGLAISRSIVQLFGGELRAHSDGPGRGASFVVDLPLSVEGVVAEGIASSKDVGVEHRERLRGLRVLYVEDEPDIVEGGRVLLSSLGVEAEVCASFAQAAARIPKGGFDILLSDLNLGDGHDALELLTILRRSPGGAHIPAVVLSAYGGAEDRQRTRQAGFHGHVVKPAHAAAVARALLDALPPRRA